MTTTPHDASATFGFRLGLRAAQLVNDDLHRREVPGHIVGALLLRLIARQDLELVDELINALDDAEEDRAAAQVAAEARAEHARREAVLALTVSCELCGQPEGHSCVSKHGRLVSPHAQRLRHAHGAGAA